jgi:serine/threonine protein phosphatase PrpC
MTVHQCPSCAAPVDASDLFCESCGCRQVEPPDAHPAPRGGTGHHVEVDLATVAAVSDRGRRHPDNEDATAIAARHDRVAIVICDGVSTTDRPDEASAVAAAAALAVLEPSLDDHRETTAGDAAALLVEAVDRAQAAVRAIGGDSGDDREPPSTTIVAALADGRSLTIGNVGDSRAYWLSNVPGESCLLTTDDSNAESLIATGADPRAVYGEPDAHAITRWLGADATDWRPAITAVTIHQPGVLLLCTDGLWNYFESADDLASIADVTAIDDRTASPIESARRLVHAALAAGGHDNVTVAVAPVRPNPHQPDRATEADR